MGASSGILAEMLGRRQHRAKYEACSEGGADDTEAACSVFFGGDVVNIGAGSYDVSAGNAVDDTANVEQDEHL